MGAANSRPTGTTAQILIKVRDTWGHFDDLLRDRLACHARARSMAALMQLEQKLSHVLSEFARTMATEFPIQAILDHLVGRIVDMLPITGAGVTLISDGVVPQYLSASGEAAMTFERLQTELDEGPCLLAYRTGRAVTAPDLTREVRFPGFTARALEVGLAAVFTFPMRHGDHQLGALDLYRDTPGVLSAEMMTAAQTLADVAAAYILNAQARDELERAWNVTQEASLHDGLTGLPNRNLLLDRLDHAFLRSRRSGQTAAVLFIDLDRLKSVNDAHGHSVGDQLLVAVSKRLTGLVRPGDTLARLSGDEFVVICEDLDDPAQAVAIGNRLVRTLGRPYQLGALTVQMSASIGLAYAENGVTTPEQLLHEADTAMYQAKRQGGGRQHMFDARLQHLTNPAAGLERDLAGALGRGELHNEYQPVVATADGRVTGFEALVRWKHPVRGDVRPSTLIPLAERSSLIKDIGRWVLAQAWADRSQWSGADGIDNLEMAVNVSARQVMSGGFADTVAAVLDTGKINRRLLTLEITESVFIQDGDDAIGALRELRQLGVKLALDDFGTGYSSLNYLQRFPVDIIKIDRSFVADLGSGRTSTAVVGAVVRLAHELGMTVVAEGVETAEQYEAVDELGCDASQGFYFARPMPASAIGTLLRHHVAGSPLRLPQPIPGVIPVPRRRPAESRPGDIELNIA